MLTYSLTHIHSHKNVCWHYALWLKLLSITETHSHACILILRPMIVTHTHKHVCWHYALHILLLHCTSYKHLHMHTYMCMSGFEVPPWIETENCKQICIIIQTLNLLNKWLFSALTHANNFVYIWNMKCFSDEPNIENFHKGNRNCWKNLQNKKGSVGWKCKPQIPIWLSVILALWWSSICSGVK